MVMQIRRTSGSGPPTGLEDGQLSVELDTTPPALWVGATGAPNARLRLNDLSGYLPLTGGHITGPVEVEAHLAAWDEMVVGTVSDSDWPVLELLRARGTRAPQVINPVRNNDVLGMIQFMGYEAPTAGAGGAWLRGIATQDWSSGNNGAKLEIWTSLNNTFGGNIVATFNGDSSLTVVNGIQVTNGAVQAPYINASNNLSCTEDLYVNRNANVVGVTALLDNLMAEKISDTDAIIVALRRGRGTRIPPMIDPVQINDVLGQLEFDGYYNATQGSTGASIRAVTTENWSATAAGTKLEIYTTADNTVGNLLAATFGQDGSLAVLGDIAAANLVLGGATVSLGPADSGGTGYRALIVPN